MTDARTVVMDGEDPATGPVVLQYKVKWSGYSKPTWVGRHDLLGAPDSLRAYEESDKGRRTYRRFARQFPDRLILENPPLDERPVSPAYARIWPQPSLQPLLPRTWSPDSTERSLFPPSMPLWRGHGLG